MEVVPPVTTSVENCVKGTSAQNASASEVLHACSPGKEISGNASPILYRFLFRKPGKGNALANIVRG